MPVEPRFPDELYVVYRQVYDIPGHLVWQRCLVPSLADVWADELIAVYTLKEPIQKVVVARTLVPAASTP